MLRFFSLSSLRVPGMHLIVLPGPGRSHSHPQAMDSGQESERSDWSGLGHAPFLDLGDEGQPHLNYLDTEQRRHNFQRKKKNQSDLQKRKSKKNCQWPFCMSCWFTAAVHSSLQRSGSHIPASEGCLHHFPELG